RLELFAGLSANYSSLVDEVRRVGPASKAVREPLLISGMLEQIGRTVAGIGGTIIGLV
ncbi:MAG TPA: ABC transporter permease, partial [Bradyrhizobium sp.]|nr:ABC transporter permease [Bradyrhizobium sp.]